MVVVAWVAAALVESTMYVGLRGSAEEDDAADDAAVVVDVDVFDDCEEVEVEESFSFLADDFDVASCCCCFASFACCCCCWACFFADEFLVDFEAQNRRDSWNTGRIEDDELLIEIKEEFKLRVVLVDVDVDVDLIVVSCEVSGKTLVAAVTAATVQRRRIA